MRQQKAGLIADRFDKSRGRHYSFVFVSRATATPPCGGASSSSCPGALDKEEVSQGSHSPLPLYSFQQQFVSQEIAQHAQQTDQTDFASPVQHTHAPDFVSQSSQASQTLEQHTHAPDLVFQSSQASQTLEQHTHAPDYVFSCSKASQTLEQLSRQIQHCVNKMKAMRRRHRDEVSVSLSNQIEVACRQNDLSLAWRISRVLSSKCIGARKRRFRLLRTSRPLMQEWQAYQSLPGREGECLQTHLHRGS